MKFAIFGILYLCIVGEVFTSLSGDNVVTKMISKLILRKRTRIVSEKECQNGQCKTVYKKTLVVKPVLIYEQIKVCRDGFIEENDKCVPECATEETTVTEPEVTTFPNEPEVTTFPNEPGFTDEVAESLGDPEPDNSVAFIITGAIVASVLAVVVIVSVLCLKNKKWKNFGSKRLLVSNLSTGSTATSEEYNDPETVRSLHVNPSKDDYQNTFTKIPKNKAIKTVKGDNHQDYQNTGFKKSNSEQCIRSQNSKEPMKLSVQQLTTANDLHSYQNTGFKKQYLKSANTSKPRKISENHLTKSSNSYVNTGNSKSKKKKQVHQLHDAPSDRYEDLIRDAEVSDHYYDSVR